MYLDHAATGPVRASVVDAMSAVWSSQWANPAAAHRHGRDARRTLDDARERLADVLGVSAADVVVTSGGTEADNQAISGAVAATGGVAVCSAAEHHAVLDPVVHSGGVVVPCREDAHIDLDALADALETAQAHQRVAVVSVMAVNNEVGTISDLDAVAAVIRRHAPGAWFHCDAVQAATWLDMADICRVADMVSLSAHKFGGPHSVGALIVRNGVSPAPLLLGGGQERGRRSGTVDVAGVVGMSTALADAAAERAEVVARVDELRNRLLNMITVIDGVVPTVAPQATVPGICHVCIEGVESEALLFMLDTAGIAASAASACASGAMQASHVTAAMGVSPSRARGALRLSLGRTTTADDIDRAGVALVDVIARLRR